MCMNPEATGSLPPPLPSLFLYHGRLAGTSTSSADPTPPMAPPWLTSDVATVFVVLLFLLLHSVPSTPCAWVPLDLQWLAIFSYAPAHPAAPL